MTHDFTHLDDLLTHDALYDIDRYAVQTGMNDPGGMWTPAYEDKITREIRFMEAHNAAHGHADQPRADRLLARFTLLLALVIGAVAPFMALAGIIALAL